MTVTSFWNNPFKVLTPEGLSAKDTVELFVEVAGLNKVREPGHTMLNGPRGSGKSMLFRYLMPDCQMEATRVRMEQLDFFSVLVPIKNTSPNLTELRRLDDEMARSILNEHALTSFVTAKVFMTLANIVTDEIAGGTNDAATDLYRTTQSLMERSGFVGMGGTAEPRSGASTSDLLICCADLCDRAYSEISQYAKRMAFVGTARPYGGPLFDFVGFLVPILEAIRDLPFFPRKAPIYLLLDDADYLTFEQTRVLNTWLSTRTQAHASLKVSTQYGYKTFATLSGRPIRSPHDYQEIDISDVYTTKASLYRKNVEAILARRLDKANVGSDPGDFFPENKRQEEAIRDLGQELRKAWSEGKGRGFRESDDVLRYARPEYFRRLAGQSKSTPSYSYAGFAQLVHISSGQIRHVLQPAAIMFDDQSSRSGGTPFNMIDPSIQDRVLRAESDQLMFRDFDNLRETSTDFEQSTTGAPIGRRHRQLVFQLRNLIEFLGGMFRLKLISNDSERRVFSVAVTGHASPDVARVFELGVAYGYFHISSIGDKEGTGRTRLYILTRRLAPYFNLDPSSFAGYQLVTNAVVQSAMLYPKRVLDRMRSKGIETTVNSRQLPLEF